MRRIKTYGSPGGGLSNSLANEDSEDEFTLGKRKPAMNTSAVSIGIQGEEALHSRLVGEFFDDPVHLFSSLAIPSKQSWGVDVDFIAVCGKRAVFIDAKVGKKNKWLWSLGNRLMAGFKQDSYEGKPRVLKATMAMAVDLYAPELRKRGVTSITPMVIYVKVNDRVGSPSNVRFLRYPGGVPSYLEKKGLRQVRKALKPKPGSKTRKDVVVYLKGYLKN